VTPAQPASLVDVLRRLYDPYGMAFGPRRPWYGYRPGPYGTPTQPWPPAFAPGWGRPGFGSSGWNWGSGPNPRYLPLKPFGLDNWAPQPPTRVRA
jgi:hypothetical protein